MVGADRHGLETLTPVYWLAIVLATVTAIVHPVLGIGFLPYWMGLAFLVATAGCLFGIALVVFEYRRRLVSLAGIPFTAAQVVIWYAVNRPAGLEDLSPVEAIDKVAQVLLILALVVLFATSDDTAADRDR